VLTIFLKPESVNIKTSVPHRRDHVAEARCERKNSAVIFPVKRNAVRSDAVQHRKSLQFFELTRQEPVAPPLRAKNAASRALQQAIVGSFRSFASRAR